MATIAFTMIGHNEARLLPRVMESLRWADQIIYVDCESSDDSMEIARSYTDLIYTQPNRSNLNINKTHGIDRATTDWIFYIDPDEVVPPALAEEIRRVISSAPEESAYKIPRRNHFFGRWLKHGGLYPDWQLRLFRRGKAHFPCRDVHESLVVEGRIGRLREPMDHFTSHTVMESLQKMEFYSTFHGELMARENPPPTVGKALQFMAIKPVSRFLRRYVLKGGFLDGWPGFLQACIGSIDFQYKFLKYWHFSKTQAEQESLANHDSEP